MSTEVVATDKDIGPVRNPIDASKLNAFFKLSKQQLKKNSKIHLGPQQQWPFVQLPVQIAQFKYGQSNPTYLITDAEGKRFTLRRKPQPTSKLISRKAHNIEREFWINYDIAKVNLKRKQQQNHVPVAAPFLLCEDEDEDAFLGVVFYMSEFVDGHIFHDPKMPSLSSEERLEFWHSVINALIQIHQLAVTDLVNSFAEPKQSDNSTKPKSKKKKLTYFQRQVNALSQIEKLQASQPKTGTIAHFRHISQFLISTSPHDAELPMLIHGDFKIDNFIFDLKTKQVIAILDWELATLGNPIFDLANLLQNFYVPEKLSTHKESNRKEQSQQQQEEEYLHNKKFVKTILTYYHDQVINEDNYVEANNGNLQKWLVSTGTKTTINAPQGSSIIFKHWGYGKVFACYRLAVIIQGIHARVMKGVSSSGNAKQYLGMHDEYGKLAEQFIRELDWEEDLKTKL